MTSRMRKHRRELCFLCTSKNSKVRKNYIKQAPLGVIDSVGDIAYTVLTNPQVPLSTKQRRYLKSKRSQLVKLANKKVGHKSKRNLLSSQVGGNILKTIWDILKGIF